MGSDITEEDIVGFFFICYDIIAISCEQLFLNAGIITSFA